MSNMAFKLARRNVSSLEEVVDEVMIQHREAMAAQDAEDLVSKVARAMEDARCAVARVDRVIDASATDEDVACAHAAAFLLSITLRLVRKVEQYGEGYANKNHHIPSLGTLKLARHEVETFAREFTKGWMLPDAGKIERARQEVAEGNYSAL